MPDRSTHTGNDDRLAKAIGGDVNALEQLLREHHASLATAVERHLPTTLRSVIAVEDILQETYIRAFRQIGNFKPDGPDALYRWLCTIAGNQIRDARRRKAAIKRGQPVHADGSLACLLELLAQHSQTPSRAAAGTEAVAALHMALAGLKSDHREVLELRYLQGLNVAQTAERMGRTDRAIHMLCHRAIKDLAEAMGTASRFFSSG